MITSLEALRALYAAPKERAVKKQLDRLDPHCIRFIGLSPFLVLASASGTGLPDASPRGGEPGFVHVLDERTLLLPDAKGNNRLDTLENIIETGRAGIIFFIPGVDETLRVNGDATLCDEPQWVERFADRANPPKLVVRITVREAYLHCAKALMRSDLWNAERHVERRTLPSMGKMINDQIGANGPAETTEEMRTRYLKDL